MPKRKGYDRGKLLSASKKKNRESTTPPASSIVEVTNARNNTPRVTDPVAPPDVLENEDDEINTPLLPTSTTFLSQELVVCTGVSSNPHYMEGFPIEYYSRFGYCFNEEEQIWRSSKCTHAKVVKGKGKINRCQPCAIRAKNRSRLSHEGIDSSQQLRILLQTDVNKGRRIAERSMQHNVQLV